VPFVAETDAPAPAAAPPAPAGPDPPPAPGGVPPGLTGHPRYRVVRLLGAGGMGAVYEAEHRVMRRPVALKVINRAYTGSAAALERFRREVHAAARLSHPNIVTTYDAEDAGETHFLVMEYVEGTDLGRLVQERGPLPVDRACDYVRQAALGLQHAFGQGMVHRDLKPHNLMLTPDGRVKTLDFGLARFASEAAPAAGLTGTGLVLGTVDYIAPEQADSPHQADIRSDIYSLGCTLYHLLAGQPPFPTGTPVQKLRAHLEKQPRPLAGLRDDLPEGLMPVLERMMAKDPRQRYQTPDEVARALQPFTTASRVGRAPGSRPHAPAFDVSRTAVLEKSSVRGRRRRRAVATAAVAFIVLAGLLGVAVYRIATDKGELVIQTDNDDVEVVVRKGGEVVKIMDSKSGKHVTLNSGDYELALKGGHEGLRLSPGKMTIKRGETVLATIERVQKPVPADTVGEARQFLGHTNFVQGVVFFRDGRRFASCGCDGTVRIWEVATGKELARLQGHNHPDIDCLALSPDQRHLLSGGFDHTLRLWDINTGKQLHSFAHPDRVGSVAFTPDGRWALSGSGPTVRLWDSKDRREVHRFNGHTWGMAAVAICSDGRRAASASWDGTVRVYDLEKREEVACLRHTDAVFAVAFSPDGSLLLTGGRPNTARLWDVKTGKELRRFEGHTDYVQTVTFSPDGRRALSAGADGTVRLWDVSTGQELHCFARHRGVVKCVACSPDGRSALSSGDDGTIRLWRLPEPPSGEKVGEVRRFEGHTGPVRSVAFSPDGRRALSGSGWPDGDSTMRLWDVETAKELHCFREEGMGWVLAVAFSSDGRHALSGSSDKVVRLWDLETGKVLRRFEGHTDAVGSVRFSPDGRHALSSSSDKTVRLWDLETAKEVRRYLGHTAFVPCVAFSPDGRRCVSAGWTPDNTLRLWDVETAKELRHFEGHLGGAHGVDFSPDGRTILSGGHDHAVRLWDAETGKQLRCLTGHTSDIVNVAFSPDGRRALSSSWDRTVRLWDLGDGIELHRFEGHGDWVHGIAFSPDGRFAISGGGGTSEDGGRPAGIDFAIRLWRLPDPSSAKGNP
jgi:WD40 repeat protein